MTTDRIGWALEWALMAGVGVLFGILLYEPVVMAWAWLVRVWGAA